MASRSVYANETAAEAIASRANKSRKYHSVNSVFERFTAGAGSEKGPISVSVDLFECAEWESVCVGGGGGGGEMERIWAFPSA